MDTSVTKKSFFSPWYWCVIKLLAVSFFSYLIFLEFILLRIVLYPPAEVGSQSSQYCEGCGLFGAISHIGSGIGKLLSMFGSMMHWFASIAIAINSVLIICWGFFLKPLFNHKKWAAIVFSIFSLSVLVLTALTLFEIPISL